ncbi:MAG: hypothetical protein R3E87_11095 [Burkholderiaceae bacterium]
MLTNRIVFDETRETMRVDFSNLVFETSAQVEAAYDQLTEAIRGTGHKWFFMVDYLNSRVDMPARLSWEHRGRKLNEAWSLGSVRYHISPDTRESLERRAANNPYYANLVDSCEQAEALVATLRERRRTESEQTRDRLERDSRREAWERTAAAGPLPDELFASRVGFDADAQTMEADFSDFDFVNDRVVNAFYDYLDARMAETGRQWYFLVNLRHCVVRSEAWFQYARRGKALNLKYSLGSVRYSATAETAAEIEKRANTEAFDPNLFSSREAAVARIAEMRAARARSGA